MKCARLIAILLAVFLLPAPPASATIIPAVATAYMPGEVLVVPKAGLQTGSTLASQSGFQVMTAHGGMTPFLRLKLQPGQTVSGAIKSLSAQSWVAHVQPNYIYHAMATPTDPDFGLEWALQNTGQTVNGTAGTAGADISAPAAWSEKTDCGGIVVAVVDTGVDYNHPDLAANMWTNPTDGSHGYDFVQNDTDPMDFLFHGTHVAGIIGAVGDNGIYGAGICWSGVQIMAVRVLNSVGVGTTATIAQGVDWAVTNGAKIINMSLGGPGGSAGDVLDTAIANANSHGVLVVAAAGNNKSDNDTTPEYPASYNEPNIISVAATDQNDNLAKFSNYGLASVDVGAPGVNILSTVPPPPTTVFSENFDTGAASGWTLQTYDTSSGSPVLTTNTVAVTNEAYLSKPDSLTDSPGGNYADNRSYRAASPVIDLSGQQGTVLSYALQLNTEPNVDQLYIDTSTNGSAWATSPLYSPLSGLYGTNWYSVEADLGALDGSATGQFRYRLDTNATNVYDGIHVDNVAVTVANTSVAAHDNSTDFAYLDGTSMATPEVTGTAALVWAADPTLTMAQLRSRILNNGDPLPALSGKTVTGRRINLQMSMPLHPATGVAATASSSTQVNLTWTDNSVSEQSYQVWRNSGSGYASIASLAANTTSYSDASAPPASNLMYEIVAVGRDGRTATSAPASVTTPTPPPPTVAGINPSSGPTSGGTPVTITGTNFIGVTSVTIGGAAATGMTAVNSTTITATTPAGTAGAANVVVTTSGGTGTGAGLFTYVYVAPSPPPSGGGGGGGCTINMQASYDPTFVIMVLLAAGYLLRRRFRER